MKKQFMSFMRYKYGSYFVMDNHGKCRPCEREECFAPIILKKEEGQKPVYDNRQRWYWDDEYRTFIIRLPITQKGIKIGNAHLAALKKDERDHVAKLQCVFFGTPRCGVTCDDCDSQNTCNSKQRERNGLKCRRKCYECPSYLCKTVDLENQFVSNDSQDYNPQELLSDCNIEQDAEDRAEIEALLTALRSLSEKQQKLIRDIFWEEMTEREIAPLLGVKSSMTVNNRKHAILEILRSDKLLKSFFAKT